MNTNGRFAGRTAPCGRRTDVEEFADYESEVLLSHMSLYGCDCRTLRHEYHDGAVSRRTQRHDGVVIVDELLAGQ